MDSAPYCPSRERDWQVFVRRSITPCLTMTRFPMRIGTMKRLRLLSAE